MDVSIVLVNYFSSGPLRECLNSLPEAVRDLECETIVVDNSPEDPALAALAGRVPGLRILSNPVNRGFARACNQGAAEARGTALLFLNPDTILADQSVKRMWNYLQAHPDAGALGPRVLNPDGSLQHSCRRFPTLGAGLFNRYSLLSRVFPRNPVTARYLMTDFDHKTTRDVDWVSGCCLMVSRKAFETAGGFDERFFLFNEDVDLCRTLNHRGFRVVYFPEAAITHRITASRDRVPARIILKRHWGMSYYYRKHERPGPLTRTAVDACIAVRCLGQLFFNLFK